MYTEQRARSQEHEHKAKKERKHAERLQARFVAIIGDAVILVGATAIPVEADGKHDCRARSPPTTRQSNE